MFGFYDLDVVFSGRGEIGNGFAFFIDELQAVERDKQVVDNNRRLTIVQLRNAIVSLGQLVEDFHFCVEVAIEGKNAFGRLLHRERWCCFAKKEVNIDRLYQSECQ